MTRLDEIRARLDNATDGPWRFDSDYYGEVWGADDDAVVSAGFDGTGGVTEPADALLIAHAPDDLQWLLAEVERAEERGYVAGIKAAQAAERYVRDHPIYLADFPILDDHARRLTRQEQQR